jgi:endoglucanase Acf2
LLVVPLLFHALLLLPIPALADIIPIGSGSYTTDLPKNAGHPPQEIYQTENIHGKMPTNRWWSSLAWTAFSDRQYPHPLAVQAAAGGLRVHSPAITASATAIFGAMPAKGEDILLGHSTVDAYPDARVDAFSDWMVSARFGPADKGVTVTYGHGCPFVYAIYKAGAARLTFTAPPKVWSGDEHAAVLGISIGDHHYGLFAPAGSTWQGWGTRVLTNQPGDKSYFSLALLPDASEKTLALFRKYAYSHVTDTRVSWTYEPKSATVTTTFSFTTHPWEGTERGTLFALYAHQWRHTSAALVGSAYPSVRGIMKLAEGTSFTTKMSFPGVLPALPRTESADAAKMAAYLKSDVSKTGPKDFSDTYGDGKWLGKQAALIPIAEQYGLADVANVFSDRMRKRLEDWFTAAGPDKQPKAKGIFHYNERWGTLIGYPAGYGSDKELNDHHFHYGYFIRAAAEAARRDPRWAADERWGGMVKLLIRDFACADRADAMFPFLRNFDPYAGHSWASGHAKFADGNNQESSSEAMNAWYGLILWGEATGDTATRDLGAWLYTTELAAIQEYWFDVSGENFPKPFTPAALGMVWGGKGAYGTWFSGDAEAIYAINWLPMHGGSLYLGRDTKYAARSYQSLLATRKKGDWKMWPDIIWMFRALSDPDDAMKQFDAGGKREIEGGNTLANTYQWITALKALGTVDASVTADHALYAVFRRGDVRSYAAYNGGGEPRKIKFSDGFELAAKPGSFALGSRRVSQ